MFSRHAHKVVTPPTLKSEPFLWRIPIFKLRTKANTSTLSLLTDGLSHSLTPSGFFFFINICSIAVKDEKELFKALKI